MSAFGCALRHPCGRQADPASNRNGEVRKLTVAKGLRGRSVYQPRTTERSGPCERLFKLHRVRQNSEGRLRAAGFCHGSAPLPEIGQ